MAIDGYLHVLTILAIVGTGVMSGLFVAWSGFTMIGLRRLPAVQGIQAMQAVNRAAERSPSLLLSLFGTGAVCIVLAIAALGDLAERASAMQLAAAACYLAGVVAMTMVFHVPRNNALDTVDPSAPGAAEEWARYTRVWRAGNHVRSLTAVASTVLFAVSLRAG